MEKASKKSGAGRTTFAAACCLILMFLGAWTCDYAMLSMVTLPEGYLSIRALSFGAYLIVFLLACLSLRGSERESSHSAHVARTLQRALILGGALLIAGFVGLIVTASEGNAISLPFVFLVKCVGPPLTIAVLILFANLPADRAPKAAALSMTVAFLVEYALREVLERLALNGEVALILGALCQVAGCLLALVLSRRVFVASLEGRGDQPDNAAAATADAVLEKTSLTSLKLRRVELVKALLCIAATALMLGYLRTGASPGNSVGFAAAVIVFIAVAAAVWCLPKLDTRALFGAAIICVSAAFLLGPMLDLAAPGISSVLGDIGTILFEIIIWIISVDIVRTRHRALRAAAGARLVAVFGHLTGALIAAAATAATASHPEASQAASLAIVFVYVVILLVFSRDTSPTTDAAGPQSNTPDTPDTPTSDAEYWEAPCRIVAAKFALTPRETEVLEQLAQGRDLAFMEEKFVLSRNTVKMHVRNVYAKLGVHSKQEVIDLVDQTRRA